MKNEERVLRYREKGGIGIGNWILENDDFVLQNGYQVMGIGYIEHNGDWGMRVGIKDWG